MHSQSFSYEGYAHIFFLLFLHKYKCSGYSLEAPQPGTSNEYPQHMFLWRNKKTIGIFWFTKVPYSELYIATEKTGI